MLGFFRECLFHTKGEWAGKPFRPLPWERDLLATLFGTFRPDGLRRYRRCYVEIPKKNGKSALAAGIALYLLLGEDEPRAEIYSVAADRDQARLVFGTAKAMLDMSPGLAEHAQIYRDSIVRPATGGVYKVVSADAPTKHGVDAHGIIFDELHAQRDEELWRTLWGATAARRQPLTFAITTAGYDRHSICWEQHDYATKVRDGVIEDDEYLPVLYAAAPADDWKDPATWAKANPSFGETVREEYLAAECRRAVASPAYENSFKRFHLNLWTEQISRWLPLDAWLACEAAVDDADLVGLEAYGGLDLGETDDFTAFVLVFLLPDGRIATRSWFWIPQATLEKRPLRPYAVWQRAGRLIVTEGASTEADVIERDVLARCQEFGVREVAFDKRFAYQMAQHLIGAGVTMIDTPQGWSLNESLRKLLALVTEGKLAHGGDPVLTWMASNVVVRTGTKGEIRIDKPGAADKIDGIAALTMALDRVVRHEGGEGESAYADGHGLVTV